MTNTYTSIRLSISTPSSNFKTYEENRYILDKNKCHEYNLYSLMLSYMSIQIQTIHSINPWLIYKIKCIRIVTTSSLIHLHFLGKTLFRLKLLQNVIFPKYLYKRWWFLFFFIQDCFSVILEDNLFLQSDISYKTYIMQNLDKNIKSA